MNDFRPLGLRTTLGIRSNNPGNIRPDSSYTWEGSIGVNAKNFVIFESIEYGLRALAMDLINKFKRGLNTVSKIISTYAPASENNTNAYIQSVCNSVSKTLRYKVNANTPLDDKKYIILALIRAIIDRENGTKADVITHDIICSGIDLLPDTMKNHIIA